MSIIFGRRETHKLWLGERGGRGRASPSASELLLTLTTTTPRGSGVPSRLASVATLSRRPAGRVPPAARDAHPRHQRQTHGIATSTCGAPGPHRADLFGRARCAVCAARSLEAAQGEQFLFCARGLGRCMTSSKQGRTPLSQNAIAVDDRCAQHHPRVLDLARRVTDPHTPCCAQQLAREQQVQLQGGPAA